MAPDVLAKLKILQHATGWIFHNQDLPAQAMTAAHRDKDTGAHSDGNRAMARSGIEIIIQCIRARSERKKSAECYRAQTTYQLFTQDPALIHVAEMSGIVSCIAHSQRQCTPQPKVITYAMRALFFAIYKDSNSNLDVICGVMDNLAQYLPLPTPFPPRSGEQMHPIETPNSTFQCAPFTMSNELTHDYDTFEKPSCPQDILFDGSIPLTANGTVLQSEWDIIEDSMLSPYADVLESTLDGDCFPPNADAMDTIYDDNFDFQNGFDSDIEMNDATLFPQTNKSGSEQGHIPEKQQDQPERLRISARISELETYLESEKSRALSHTEAHKKIFQPFDVIFSHPYRSFSHPGTMWKLFLAPTSSQVLICIKKALAICDQGSATPGGQAEPPLQFHYRMIKQISGESTANIIRLRHHLHQFYISQRPSSQGALQSFEVHTNSSFSRTPARRPGNPVNKQKSLLDKQLVQSLYPGRSFEASEYKRIKADVRSFNRAGQRLDDLVGTLNRGILCILPFPGSINMEHKCLSTDLSELKDLRNDEFRAVVKALSQNSALYSRFCEAAEPILDIITGMHTRRKYKFRMENTDEAELKTMVQGSRELLAQFDHTGI